MIYSTAMASKLGMTEVNMKEIMLMVKSKEKVYIHGQMDQGTRENGMVIYFYRFVINYKIFMFIIR